MDRLTNKAWFQKSVDLSRSRNLSALTGRRCTADADFLPAIGLVPAHRGDRILLPPTIYFGKLSDQKCPILRAPHICNSQLMLLGAGFHISRREVEISRSSFPFAKTETHTIAIIKSGEFGIELFCGVALSCSQFASAFSKSSATISPSQSFGANRPGVDKWKVENFFLVRHGPIFNSSACSAKTNCLITNQKVARR